MFKAILIFIKTHAVATAITTTVVVTGAVAAPIVVDNYKLEKSVEANLGMLAKSDEFVANDAPETTDNSVETNTLETIDNSVIKDNSIENENVVTNEEVITNNTEPLTFRVEREVVKFENGSSISYNIVPSYDKDASEWTKEEKEAYMKAVEELYAMGEADHEALLAEEERKLREAELELEKMMSNSETE